VRVRVVGVDLAAEPARTAVAVLKWDDGKAVVEELRVGADDQAVLAALTATNKAGESQDDGPDVGVTLRRCVHVTKGSPLNLTNSGASPAVRCMLNKVHLNYAYEPS
jgi:hypothetical protein